MSDPPVESPPWSAAASSSLYEVERWGQGYFSVGGDGHLRVHPRRDPDRFIDLFEQVERLQVRGIKLPILFRFGQILQDRFEGLHDAFQAAIREHQYQGAYHCLYPIKVNQQRQVVEEVLRHGLRYGFGLEVGSKPELVAVICLASNDTPIICNGFKDAEYLEAVMLAQKIGRNIIAVIEKYSELELALHFAKKAGVKPRLGMRAKLASKGSGRWQSSGGNQSKFGLTVAEILQGIDHLESVGMLDCLKLLHFHLGSQITDIRNINHAVEEAARMYVELVRVGAPLEMIDVGGGLGVDYDGSQTANNSSVNYSLEEYSANVVYQLQSVCDQAGVAHPTILSESGRAVAAYHSLLVFDVLGTSQSDRHDDVVVQADAPDSKPLEALLDVQENLQVRHPLESFHDVGQALETAMSMFRNGQLSLPERARIESLYWSICHKLRRRVERLEFVPEELQRLDDSLAGIYFCNFSLFQSVPDSWAIRQYFPIMPIHRLDEYPDRWAVLGDITCDSDGKFDHFRNGKAKRGTMRLHALNGKPYYLSAFLVGAYQEVLGDLHNLLGDTNAVQVHLNEDNETVLENVVEGDTVREVLKYVEFDVDRLVQKLRSDIDTALRANRIDDDQSFRILRFFKQRLQGYTYLTKPRLPQE